MSESITKQQWFVYIVECRDGSYYTGITTNIQERVAKHNAGIGAKYTRARMPVRVVYSENSDTLSSAAKREAQIKKLTRSEKEVLVKKRPLVLQNN